MRQDSLKARVTEYTELLSVRNLSPNIKYILYFLGRVLRRPMGLVSSFKNGVETRDSTTRLRHGFAWRVPILASDFGPLFRTHALYSPHAQNNMNRNSQLSGHFPRCGASRGVGVISAATAGVHSSYPTSERRHLFLCKKWEDNEQRGVKSESIKELIK